MNIRAFKYLSPLILIVGAYLSFTSYGIECYYPLIYAWVFIPLLELFINSDNENLSQAEEEVARVDTTYDFILYALVFLMYPILFLFLNTISDPRLTSIDIIGRVGTMGLLCGTLGINVGHELGHRKNQFERFLAKASLMTSLYMHFIIEHNRGHHKRVATAEDPSSARFGEIVYAFWLRSAIFSYVHAWSIANEEMIRKGRMKFSLQNEMIQIHITQSLFVVTIFSLFGLDALSYYLLSAMTGILLLETVNYIEHYGLSRKQFAAGRYERAMPQHSWNSNHIIGRIMLFELSRHSDHHYVASRKYQLLRHHEGAPQMPTGYPGMMMLSMVPPLWFMVMNRKINKLSDAGPTVDNTVETS